jgi:hypothetical protein
VGRTAEEELREAALDFRILIVLILALLGVITLLLWPLGELKLAFSLAKGMGVLYVTTYVVFLVALVIQNFFRVNIEDRSDAFLLSNLAVSAILHVGWAAFAALAVRAAAAGEPVWRAAILWVVGLFTCWMAYNLVGTWYSGRFYRYKNLPLAAASFAVFALWPAAARFLFGWYFDVWS